MYRVFAGAAKCLWKGSTRKSFRGCSYDALCPFLRADHCVRLIRFDMYSYRNLDYTEARPHIIWVFYMGYPVVGVQCSKGVWFRALTKFPQENYKIFNSWKIFWAACWWFSSWFWNCNWFFSISKNERFSALWGAPSLMKTLKYAG